MSGVQTISFGINSAIAVLTIVAWVQILRSRMQDARSLAQGGLMSLQYFTVLSNLLSCIVSAVYAVFLLCSIDFAGWLLVLKLVAATEVMLTFFTVVLFLGPRQGWKMMYEGGNFWMHLVLPLLAAIDCCCFAPVGTLPFAATLFSLVPQLLYGAWYGGRVLVHGVQKDDKVYDFYGFFAWGIRILPLVVGVMLASTCGLSVSIWLLSRH